MGTKENTRGTKLNNDLDPDFDLDGYIEEQAKGASSGSSKADQDEINRDGSYKVKNSLTIVAVFTVLFLWAFDWSPKNAYEFFFPPEPQTVATTSGAGTGAIDIRIPPININIPDFEIPDIEIPDFEIPDIEGMPVPAGTNNAPPLDMSYTDYLAALNDLGYLDEFGSSSLSTLYQNNVPVSYIDQFGKAGMLNDFGGTSITRFFNNGVPFNYIVMFKERGLLDNLGSTSISQLYANEVPMSYIDQFQKAGIMDNFGGQSITRLFQNNVPVSYILEINEIGVLDNFGSTSISRLYQNNVPVSFIKELNERGLLDNMSSSSIVDAYNIDGN